MLKRCSFALIGALCLCALPQAWAQTVIYTNDFESGQIGPEWSSNTHLDTISNSARLSADTPSSSG